MQREGHLVLVAAPGEMPGADALATECYGGKAAALNPEHLQPISSDLGVNVGPWAVAIMLMK